MVTTVYKQLATKQDLAIGNGKVNQLRNNVLVELDLIDGAIAIQNVARSLNVLDIQVIYGINGQVITAPAKYIYDSATQITWELPTNVIAGEIISSVVGNTLTTNYSVYTLSVVATKNIVVSGKAFGAKGDGVTDDTAALNKVLAASTGRVVDLEGATYFIGGMLTIGSNIVLRNGVLSYNDSTGNTFRCSNSKNVVIENITFIGKAAGLISIRDGSSDITIRDCEFDGAQGAAGNLTQLIWLFACNNIKVLNNTFKSTGYCVITQAGYVSDDVIIHGNYIENSYNDFVEANSASVKCKNWTITNNIYKGGVGWPTVQTERRFVGITEVENVIIANNIVEKVCGDGAIHLEDLYGDTIIDGNIFENWVGNSCLYILNTDEDCVISNNIFKRTEAVVMPAAISTESNVYEHSIIITGNKFEDVINDVNRFKAIASTYGGKFIITSNIALNCDYLCRVDNTNGTLIANNRVITCTAGILANFDSSGNRSSGTGGDNVVVVGNYLDVTNTNYAIASGTNVSGTNGPKRWFVSGNNTNGRIYLNNGSGSVGQTLWNVVSGNYLRGSATVNVSDYGGTGRARADVDGNFYEGSAGAGWSGTFLNGSGATVTVSRGIITSVV